METSEEEEQPDPNLRDLYNYCAKNHMRTNIVEIRIAKMETQMNRFGPGLNDSGCQCQKNESPIKKIKLMEPTATSFWNNR